MSRTLKFTGNHIMYDHGAWFLRVSYVKFASFVFLAVSGKAKTWLLLFSRSMYNKTITSFVFFIYLGKGYQPQLEASADNFYLDLVYFGCHKNLIYPSYFSRQSLFGWGAVPLVLWPPTQLKHLLFPETGNEAGNKKSSDLKLSFSVVSQLKGCTVYNAALRWT